MPHARALTPDEIALAQEIFGDAIDYAPVRIVLGKWAFFQPRETVMAPLGHIHCHRKGHTWREDYAAGSASDQGLFIHEMTHVWQHQQGIFLPIARHPFCRYGYTLTRGKPFHRYGIEQQAEIVRHSFMLTLHSGVAAPASLADYHAILPFAADLG